MNGKDTYQAVAQAYAEGVRGLSAPSGATVRERGSVQTFSSFEEFAKQAEKLSAVSDHLASVISGQLADADSRISMDASIRMLAKALTDLEIGGHLLSAAEDEINKVHFNKSRKAVRGAGAKGGSEEYLKILLAETGAPLKRAVRTGGPPNIDSARIQLSAGITDSLLLISEKAASVAQSSLGGLVGLGAGELAQAVGTLGSNIAGILGQAERISHLYELFRNFIGKVYEALASLVGEALMQKAGRKVVEWLSELKEGKYIAEIVEALYQTGQTRETLNKLVGESPAPLDQFTSTIQKVAILKDGYGKQAKLAEKLLTGLKFIGGLSENVLPQARLILAAAYIAIGGYVVLAGADYVDSPRIKWMDRVSGVRRTVENDLQGV